MAGMLMTRHPPEVVRRMRLSEARACLRALYDERRQQVELLAALFGAKTAGMG